MIARRRGRDATSQRGSASVELSVLTMPCVFLLAILTTGFRIADAEHRLSGVASAAAREASLGRDAGNAKKLAESKARKELNANALRCMPAPNVSAQFRDTWESTATPGTVQVTVKCSVPFADLGLPFLKGSRTLTDVAVSPIDHFRSTTNSGGDS